jgi:uncharacterized protein
MSMKYPTRSYTGVDALLCGVIAAVAATGSFGREATRDHSPFAGPDIGYVTDRADILSSEQEQQLERLLQRAEKETGVEIVVITIRRMVDYPGASNESIEGFARGLFNAYGIGNLPKNNGVLLLVSVLDRKARIELGAGYRHRRDRDARRIMDRKILPYLRQEEYQWGIIAGVNALVREFGRKSFIVVWGPWILVGAVVLLIPVTISLFRNGKRGWGWVVVGLIIVLLLAAVWVIRRVGEESNEDGGVLGGFGGGFSGGGGATGSW